MLVVYTLSNCSTCRTATKWLRAHKIAFEERAIRETPPKPAELSAALKAQGGNLRKLFNTAGQEYRALGLAEKMDALGTDEALRLLAGNGSLVKRPFAVGAGVALVGFDDAAWTAALAKR